MLAYLAIHIKVYKHLHQQVRLIEPRHHLLNTHTQTSTHARKNNTESNTKRSRMTPQQKQDKEEKSTSWVTQDKISSDQVDEEEWCPRKAENDREKGDRHPIIHSPLSRRSFGKWAESWAWWPPAHGWSAAHTNSQIRCAHVPAKSSTAPRSAAAAIAKHRRCKFINWWINGMMKDCMNRIASQRMMRTRTVLTLSNLEKILCSARAIGMLFKMHGTTSRRIWYPMTFECCMRSPALRQNSSYKILKTSIQCHTDHKGRLRKR